MAATWPCTGVIGPQATGKSYEWAFATCMRPLSEFLNALVSDDATWREMMHDFWLKPFETARIAGLPWEACIALAEGDRDTIDRLVNLEIGRSEAAKTVYYGTDGGASGGPIGVKLR